MKTEDKQYLLSLLVGYRDNMSEFDEEDMDYMIGLVKHDLRLDGMFV